MRILIAEDEERMAALIAGALGEEGHAIDVAHDGAAAFALANPSSPETTLACNPPTFGRVGARAK